MKKARNVKVGVFIALAAALSCSSAIALSNLCLKEEGGVIPVYAETASVSPTTTASAQEIASLWSSAVQESIDTGKQVTFTLPDDWTAPAAGSHKFGEGDAFDGGRLLVPSGADVVLDLNGHTIDRGLTSPDYGGGAMKDGGVIVCIGGSLEVSDSAGGGLITGGRTTADGGGVGVANGTFTMNGGTITGNTASACGGIYLYNSEFTMNGGEISGNSANHGGGVCFMMGSTFTMNGGEISGNTAVNYGGGVYVDAEGTFTMTGGTISENTVVDGAAFGGGVYVSANGGFNMLNGTISANNACYGGGVFSDGTFNMSGGTIGGDNEGAGNKATRNGGGIYIHKNGSVTVTGGSISYNKALNEDPAGTGWGQGGGIACFGSLTISSDTVSINNNSAKMSGGGVAVFTAPDAISVTFTLNAGTIKNNSAASGGGVHVSQNVVPVLFEMNGGTISSNTATTYGGGVYVGSGTFTMNGGEISENTVADGAAFGGGVYVSANGGFNMLSGTISANNACYGGGVFSDGTFNMSGGTIGGDNEGAGNKATRSGGGIYVYKNSSVTVTGGSISYNKALNEDPAGTGWGQGGGIACFGSLTISSDTVSINNNSAKMSGGGVAVFTAPDAISVTFTLNAGAIKNNSAASGGGVHVSQNVVPVLFEMNGGEISGNTATENGGGVFNDGTFNLKRGIIYGNFGTDGNANNLSLDSSKIINITGKLSANTHIGISADAARTLTSGYASSGNKIGNEARYFVSDKNAYIISNNGTEVTLTQPSPAVTKSAVDWSYKVYDSSFTLIAEEEVEAGVYLVTDVYTGGAFVFDAIKAGIATAVDENGKTVTSFTNAGKYYLSVINTNSYTNPFFEFEILPADFTDEDVQVMADSAVYTGSGLTTSVKVLLGGVLLEEGKDYTVSYRNNVNAGEATVIITAKGNYTGSVEGSFTIEKAKIGVRWGDTKLTYNGGEQGVTVYPEGLAAGDKVNLTVKYFDENGDEVTPENVGKYVAKVVLDDDNYKLSRSYEEYFLIVAKNVSVTWEQTSFVYSGESHDVKAYIMHGGEKVWLTVTADDTVNAGEYTATATLPEGFENYVLTSNTASVTYKIEKAEVEAEWSEYSFKYDGEEKAIEVTLTGLNGEPLSGKVVYTYFDANGNEVIPVDAGAYTVVISLTDDNYVLTGKVKGSFTISKLKIAVVLDEEFDGEYTGEGKTRLKAVQNELGNELEEGAYTVSYASVDGNGNIVENLGETLPVNAGKYILTVLVNDANLEQTTFTAEFVITAKTVAVEWNFGGQALEIDGVYTYLYDGNVHQPTATADGIALTVTGTGKSVRNGYKAEASTDNPNYVLSGDTVVYFNIIKSKVASVLWYEYGATEPVADGDKLSYEYISVYGQDGPKLSAYGVLTAADDAIVWNGASQTLIMLDVSYDRHSSGYWTELGTYTASASLSSADSHGDFCYMPLGINDSLEFEVTAITHSASVAEIMWIVVVDGKHVSVEDYKFIYNGEAQAPVAIRILSNSYNPKDPDEDTFEFLKVGGKKVNAGTYYAYIIPEGNYEIREEDWECRFVISPVEITIDWEETVFTYDGEKHAPTATVVGADGITCEVTVEGYVEAGTYFAFAEVSGNFVITGDTEYTLFTIEQLKLSADDIVWSFTDGDEGEKRTASDGTEYYVWKYDGNSHTLTASLTILVNGEEVAVSLSLTGGASTVGTHYVYATLDSTAYANANYEMAVARVRLDIVQDSVTVIWEGLTVTYDGEAHTPSAYYIDEDGNRVDLNVVGSGTEAGKYVAFITDNIDIENGSTNVFVIEAKQITAVWGRTSFEYNGKVRTPSVTFYETDEEGNLIEVVLPEGSYTVTGYTNAGTYLSEITLLNGNYEIADGYSVHELTITKKVVNLIWYGVDGSTEDFEWKWDGEEHAPSFEASVEGLEIVVKGAEKQVGTYTAVALIANDNYKISNPEQEYSIKGNAITVIWVGNENAAEGEDEFSWSYSGEKFVPKAYIALEGGGLGSELPVVGAGVYAGEYTAKAVLPANCEWADSENAECKFTITKQVVNGIIWYGVDGSEDNFDWKYDGQYHAPAAVTLTGEKLTVEGAAVNACGDGVTYTATAILANYENYEFAEGVEYTHEFTIHARTVSVTWEGDDDSWVEGTYIVWAYDGAVHCPTAWFRDVNGNKVEIPVIGGTASGGEHNAELRDVFANYEFTEGKQVHGFKITENEITVEWTGGTEDENGKITFTYTYNGTAQMPVATAKNANGETVSLNYVIVANGEVTGAIIGAGEYTVTVTSADKNNKITEGETEVKVIVKKLEVDVKWGDTELIDNGTEQVPKAWFEYEDGNGQKITVTLKVQSVKTEDGYTATAILENSDNFILSGKTTSFSIVQSSDTEYKWVWDEDGNGSWVAKTQPDKPNPEEPDPEEGDDND